MKFGLTRFFRETFELPEILGVTPEAEAQRNELAMAALAVETVSNAEEQAQAARAAVDIQTYIRRVEQMGLDFRRPLNDAAALVKRTQDEHLAPLLEEKERLRHLVSSFDEQEKARVVEEERLRRAEFERLAAARQSALEAAQKAEADMREATDREVACQQMEAQQEAEARAQAVNTTLQSALREPLPEASKAPGTSVRQRLRVEVVEARTVYASRPDLCKVEVKAAAVQAVIVAQAGATALHPDLTTVPGLKLWWESQAQFRKR